VIIVFDGFDSRKFTSTNLIHQFPRTTTFIHNFLNFCVKEGSLDVLNYLLETLPIVETSCHSIVIEKTVTSYYNPNFMFKIRKLIKIKIKIRKRNKINQVYCLQL